jgi:hypothetical protein
LGVEAFRAVEDRLDAVPRRLERACDDLLRGAVATERVDGDLRHALGSRGAERLDLAACVRLAGRAHPVRLLRLAALRAEVQARRFDPVVGPALVAARL